MKVYAVRVGRTPGIYRTWKECKQQVHRFPGAEYKSFWDKALAEKFMARAPPPPLPSKRSPSDVLRIYVDGSHIKGTERRGYGILCCYQDKEYALSRSIPNSAAMKAFFGGDFTDKDTLSNPTMEFAAVAHVLHLLDASQAHFGKTIFIHYDYIGSVHWLNGKWRAKQSAIQNLLRFARPRYHRIQRGGTQIQWIHIQAHSGHRENDITDRLAKGERVEGMLHLGLLFGS